MNTRRLSALAAMLVGLIWAAPGAWALSFDELRDPEDGRFDASRYLLDHKGLLPVPLLITEPALGYGLGAALLFFQRNPPLTEAGRPPDGFTPPDISALGGFRTENGSDGVFAGHLGFSSDRRWRYVAGLGKTSLNLAFYADGRPEASGAQGLDYRLDANFAIADVRRRLGDTEWFAGLRYLRADTTSHFENSRPDRIPERQLDTTLAGLALVAEYDGRDSIFTPSTGTRLTLQAYDFGKTWGGDPEFRMLKAAANSFWPLGRRFVLGARADFRGVSGDTPFYALPFIELRGIPALRYQGERVGVIEAEGRWNLDGRWSLVGFGGAGRVSGGYSDAGADSTHGAAGLGVRYFLARALGLHVGVDLARGPEESALYIIFGSAWR